MIHRFQVTLYEWDEDTKTWSETPVYLTEAYDVQVSTALGDTRDTFNFKLNNHRNTVIDIIKAQDKITIHSLINGATATDSNLLITGLVKLVSEQVTDKGRILRIEGVSFGEITTTGLVFHNTATSHTDNVMTFLRACLNSVALRNTNFNITWSSTNPTLKFNTTTGAYDGSAFPTLNSGNQVREFDKSLAAVLDKYLVDGYTGDGKYYWYVNTSNELVIRKRYVGDTNPTPLIEGSNIKTLKTGIDVGDVKNYVIVKCGKDLDNRPITTRADDPVSRAKHGFKYYIYVDEQIAEKIRQTGAYSGDNDAFREAVKADGRKAGQDFIQLHNQGVIKADVIIAPSVTFTIGDKVNLTAPSYNLTNKTLRIKDMTYDIDSTTIGLVEEVVQ